MLEEEQGGKTVAADALNGGDEKVDEDIGGN